MMPATPKELWLLLCAKMVSTSLVPGDRVWSGHRFYHTGDLLFGRRCILDNLPSRLSFGYTGLRLVVPGISGIALAASLSPCWLQYHL
jgi:hypothetical protein